MAERVAEAVGFNYPTTTAQVRIPLVQHTLSVPDDADFSLIQSRMSEDNPLVTEKMEGEEFEGFVSNLIKAFPSSETNAVEQWASGVREVLASLTAEGLMGTSIEVFFPEW